MKFTILLSILFDLLTKRKLTARSLAEKYEISSRTVYRYVELLSEHLPLVITRGRNGGVCLTDNYKLPVGFMTEREYSAVVEALVLAYSQTAEEKFLLAKRKITAQNKFEKRELALYSDVGNFFTDGSVWGDIYSFFDKVKLINDGIQNRRVLSAIYQTQTEERLEEIIEPHALVLQRGVWQVFAFCHSDRTFRRLRLGGIFALSDTGATFRKRPFPKRDTTLYSPPLATVAVRLEISQNAYEAAQNWLGVETLKKWGKVWRADVVLPDDRLPAKILSLGEGVKVLEPLSLQREVQKIALAVAKRYS